ncbi:CHAT domain-containing protein [Brasilonema sp. CT11]|nr:CHAT domain-containing protein [Brasilonema sp. CT11]
MALKFAPFQQLTVDLAVQSGEMVQALELAEQGKNAEDICQFNLSHYELVSLSACETAVTGNQTISTEYVGLVSGFVRQGVAHVVSTLWRVESVSSALFMMEFYRQLNRDIEPTTALKQTQIWLASVKYSELVQWYKDIATEIAQSDSLCAEDLKDKAKIIEYDVEKINSFVPFGCAQGKSPYAHPYFWASFIITGTV